MQREKGWKAPKSGVGFPHGKDKKRERARRVAAKIAEKVKPQKGQRPAETFSTYTVDGTISGPLNDDTH